MADALISIVIPGRNEAANLPLLIDEIASAMSGRDFEIIIVDDGSTDDTAAVLAAQASTQPFPVRHIRHDKSSGQSLAVRSGIWAARGDIVATIDGDGQNDPQYIPVLVDALRNAGPDVAAAQGQRLKRRALPHADQSGGAAFQRLGHPQRPGEYRVGVAIGRQLQRPPV